MFALTAFDIIDDAERRMAEALCEKSCLGPRFCTVDKHRPTARTLLKSLVEALPALKEEPGNRSVAGRGPTVEHQRSQPEPTDQHRKEARDVQRRVAERAPHARRRT